MKKIFSFILVISMSIMMIGCGNKTTTVKPDTNTMGGKYGAAFLDSESSDVQAVVDELVALDIMENLVSIEVEPGYLDGFDADITGFSKGVRFSPMIGSIPFVAYVLETDDTSALIKELQDNANMAWNICTMADEMYVTEKGDLVFFIMCSNE